MTSIMLRPASPRPAPNDPPVRAPTRLARAWRGDPRDPRWVRPSLLSTLLATALLYLTNLSASGYGNTFYAAAVQAGTQSWKAFFFGSFDSSNYITVDKPPASLWVMELSGRLFGFSSWSMLAPQAIEGVLAVGLLYGAVKRVSGPTAGLVAGAALALTPAAALMFRFNNPDALLVLLLVAGGYFLIRALQSGRTSWLLLVGTCVGFGFLAKMGQSLLVVPAFALAYLVAGPPKLLRRIRQLLLAGLAMVLSAGWWVAVVELTPASSRPYVGGSTNNSILNLAFGYNGFGRLFGGSGNGGGGGGGGFGAGNPTSAAVRAASSAASNASSAASSAAPSIGGGGGSSGAMTNSAFGGATGITRLFSQEMGLQISWLLPAALIALISGLWLTRHAARTDLTRAALILWGGWLLVTGLVFSYMQGTIHPYYTIALAPAIGGVIGTTGAIVWRRRSTVGAQIAGAAMLIATGVWSYHLLDETPTWWPGLRYAAAGIAIFGALVFCMNRHVARSVAIAGVAAGAVLLSGSGAYAIATTTVAHTGSTPTVGSASSANGSAGGPGSPSGVAAADVAGGFGGGRAAGFAATSNGTNTALSALLKASTTKWAAAASSSMTAGSLELSSGKAVMSIGGFNGSDNAITLAQFKALVAAGRIGYFIGSGGGGGMGGGASTAYSAIASWVSSTFTASTVGGTTVYNLTAAK